MSVREVAAVEGSASPESNVHEGKDGVLFLVGGAHSVLDYFAGTRDPSRSSIESFRRNLVQRKTFCSSRGIPTRTFVFPDKLYALRDHVALPRQIRSLYLDCYAPELGDSAAAACYLASGIVGNRASFHDRDTHNSALGCRRLTANILADIAPDRADRFERVMEAAEWLPRRFSGDLGRKVSDCTAPDSEDCVPKFDACTVAENGIASGNEGVMVISENEAVPDGRLLIFGDSFLRQLIPFLSSAFRVVLFCRTRYFHAELVDACSPDLVIAGLAERYLSRVRLDRTRPHFLAYPFLTGRAVAPGETFSRLWLSHVDSSVLAHPGA